MTKDYSGDEITVHWDAQRCIHVGLCTAGLPGVFDVSRRPWIDVSAADADAVAEVVRRCPTGALRYTRHDGGLPEAAPDVTTVTPMRDGPLFVTGKLRVTTPDGTVLDGETRLALCRCGATANAPLCDNSHRRVGFHTGAPGPDPRRAGAAAPDDICERQAF